jgi:Flp pilus assembly protein TadG
MEMQTPCLKRCNSGQALLETALILPTLLMLVFNAVNFGYFLLIALDLGVAPRNGVLYSIAGSATPGSLLLPVAGPSSAI